MLVIIDIAETLSSTERPLAYLALSKASGQRRSSDRLWTIGSDQLDMCIV